MSRVEPTDAFEVLYEGVMEPFHSRLRALVTAILDVPLDETETKLRTYALAGQIFIFHIARAETRRSMNWAEYGPEELDHDPAGWSLEQVRALLGIPREILDSYFSSINE